MAEVLLALALLSVGVTSAMRAAVVCGRALRLASVRQAALLTAESVLDSLVNTAETNAGPLSGGSTTIGGVVVRWRIEPDGPDALVHVDAGVAGADSPAVSLTTITGWAGS